MKHPLSVLLGQRPAVGALESCLFHTHYVIVTCVNIIIPNCDVQQLVNIGDISRALTMAPPDE